MDLALVQLHVTLKLVNEALAACTGASTTSTADVRCAGAGPGPGAAVLAAFVESGISGSLCQVLGHLIDSLEVCRPVAGLWLG